jgi:hypothetical protein
MIRNVTIKHLVVIVSAVLLVALASCSLKAQDLITTMTQQIAKLELHLQELKKGYDILQHGLTTIGNIKHGDFDLHNGFFNSLMEVKPAIKGYGKVADMLTMQIQVLTGCTATMRQYVFSGMFSTGDLKYLSDVYANLTDLTLKDMDELAGLVTDGQWQMSDDQRLHRIDQLYLRVQSKYSFLRTFSDRVLQEANLRKQEKLSLQHLGKIIQP